jgi:hypothetical protein
VAATRLTGSLFTQTGRVGKRRIDSFLTDFDSLRKSLPGSFEQIVKSPNGPRKSVGLPRSFGHQLFPN